MITIWRSYPLEKLATIVNGYSFKSGDFSTENEVQSIKITNVGVQKFIEGTDKLLPSVYREKHSNYLVEAGDITIALTRTLISSGLKVAIVPASFDRALINQRVAAIKVDAKVMDKDFLYYYLTSQPAYDYVKASVNELMQPNLSIKDLKSFTVPCPTTNEQKNIVTILDKAFADIEKARANAEQNLKNSRELFDSYLQEVFSERNNEWTDTTLGKVCDFLNGFAFKSKDSVDDSNTQLIRMGNLYRNVLNLDRKPSYFPDSFSKDYKKYILAERDLIMSLTGTTDKEDYGYTVEIPSCEKTLLLNQRIVKFIDIDKNKIEHGFLLRILRSRIFLDKLYSTANGTRQANLSTVTMKNIKISFPSIKEQKTLVETFDTLDIEIQSLERNYKKKIDALDELKKSILQKAFSGELTQSEGVAA